MQDGNLLKAICMITIAAVYIAYMVIHPEADGVLFGTVMLLLGALAGIKLNERVVNYGTLGRK